MSRPGAPVERDTNRPYELPSDFCREVPTDQFLVERTQRGDVRRRVVLGIEIVAVEPAWLSAICFASSRTACGLGAV